MHVACNRLEKFFFPEISDVWLSILRIGLGLQIIFYCLSLWGDWNNLFALHGSGFISRDLSEAILSADSLLIPRLGWLVALVDPLGLKETTMFSLVWICLFCTGFCLLFGFCCRASAVIAWFLYVCAAKSSDLLTYGVDHMTTTGLFYLMLAPLPDRCALDWKLRKARVQHGHLLGFFRRVLQLHLCVIYFSGGLAKCLGVGWWNGESMWRALVRPPFDVVPFHIIISWKAALPFVGIAVCLLETGYPFLIWARRTRLIWLVGILGMHVAIGLTMGLYLFAFVMIVLNLAAFGTDVLPFLNKITLHERSDMIQPARQT